MPKKKNISLNNQRLHIYYNLLRLRKCEEALVKEYHPADEMKCPVHFCIGQEATPSALKLLIKKKDILFCHHRSHGYYLAKKAPMNKLFSELYGKKTGANQGLAGSQDISYPSENFFGGAILAGSVGLATGASLGIKIKKNKAVAITIFGESATDQGLFWESMNYSALKKLPLLYICENNDYSVFSPSKNRQSGVPIYLKARAFGVKSKKIFGNDAVNIYENLKKILSEIRKKNQPFLLELDTYRISAHYGPETDLDIGYRSKKEIDFWKKKCPIKIFESKNKKLIIKNQKKISIYLNKINTEIEKSFKFAKKSHFPKIKNFQSLNYSEKINFKNIKYLNKSNWTDFKKIKQIKGY